MTSPDTNSSDPNPSDVPEALIRALLSWIDGRVEARVQAAVEARWRQWMERQPGSTTAEAASTAAPIPNPMSNPTSNVTPAPASTSTPRSTPPRAVETVPSHPARTPLGIPIPRPARPRASSLKGRPITERPCPVCGELNKNRIFSYHCGAHRPTRPRPTN